MRSTKKSLIASGLSLLVCFALLIGTTFAWFTDSITNSGNKIQAGTLKIGLDELRESSTGGPGDYVSVGENPIFDYELWEPGYSDVAVLRVSNLGSLALKFNLQLIANGDAGRLGDVIDVYALVQEGTAITTIPENLDTAIAAGYEKVGTLNELMADPDGVAHGVLYAANNKPADGYSEVYAGIVLHMQENAGNEYQGLAIGTTFDIQLNATQYTYEEDGFGNSNYDADAVYQQVNVTYDETKTERQNGEALQKAVAEAEEGTVIYVESGVYDLPRDDGSNVEEQSGWYFAIDTDNLTIIGEEGTVLTSNEYSANGAWASQNMVTIFGDNVTLEGLTIKCKMDANKAIEVRGKDSTIRNVQVLCNDILTHEEYLAGKGIEKGADTDYWDFYNSEFAGSLYYAGDIGNATLENFYIDKAWISTTDVTNGTVSMADVTIGYAGCGYADSSLPISDNAGTVLQNGSELTIEIDNQLSDLQGLIDRIPEGATIKFAAGTYAVLNALSIGSKTIVIEGTENTTFEAGGEEGYLTIRGSKNAAFTIRNVEFAGSERSGNGLCFSGQGNTNATLNVEECTFSSVNTGIYLGGVANATITGCTFTDCNAGIGGSEQISENLKVDACTFTGNTENIGWAGSGTLYIADSLTCTNFNDYTSGSAVSVTVETQPFEYPGN